MKTCKEKALEWNVSPRSVNDMCKKGRIQGAIKEKGSWLIPDDSPKPMDGRVSNGKYIKKNMVAKAEVKSLPIGISDYVRAQEEYYYVDKTLLIKEFLDQKPLVSLFTRPRRFGKTLNMDMLRVFFEISDKNTSKYFADKNIWQCGEEYRSHQGKYPVIFLTFKDVKFDTWDATIDKIRGLLQEEYGRHQELLNSDKLSQYEKEYFTKIISATANEVELTSSLERLSKMLASHYDKAPVIIIDEYDTPIQEGYSKDFYNEIIGFMRNFFSGAFKDNKNLSYGFLTGILRIAQESIFSGLNNLTVNSVMDEEYDSFFGFTESEVKAMLSYYGVSDKEEELKDWYDGYLFGSEEIYNPWSVINYISKGYYPIFSELLSRGVSVQIIVNDDSNNARYKCQIDSLICLGARVIMINASGTMHHKFCVIDEVRCLFGSYNWTINAELRNIEDLNICDEPQLVYNYLQEFIALRELSKTDLKLLRNPAKCNLCGNPKMNILIIEQDGNYQTKVQIMELCGCRYHWCDPEYYDISVYSNYIGIIEKYENDIEYFNQYNDERFLEEIKAKMDFEIAMYWSTVRYNRFGFVIIHAVGMPGSRMYGGHDEEYFYHMVWKERGMENFIPDEIPRDEYM